MEMTSKTSKKRKVAATTDSDPPLTTDAPSTGTPEAHHTFPPGWEAPPLVRPTKAPLKGGDIAEYFSDEEDQSMLKEVERESWEKEIKERMKDEFREREGRGEPSTQQDEMWSKRKKGAKQGKMTANHTFSDLAIKTSNVALTKPLTRQNTVDRVATLDKFQGLTDALVGNDPDRKQKVDDLVAPYRASGAQLQASDRQGLVTSLTPILSNAPHNLSMGHKKINTQKGSSADPMVDETGKLIPVRDANILRRAHSFLKHVGREELGTELTAVDQDDEGKLFTSKKVKKPKLLKDEEPEEEEGKEKEEEEEEK